MSRKITKALAVTLLVALMGVFSMPAFSVAQTACTSATDDQYQDESVCIQARTGAGTAAPPAGTAAPPSSASSTGSLSRNVGPLPFTGFDVIAMAAVALAVTGLGLALQRAVVRQSE